MLLKIIWLFSTEPCLGIWKWFLELKPEITYRIRFSNLLLVHNDQINDLLEPSYVICRYIFNKKLQLLLGYTDISCIQLHSFRSEKMLGMASINRIFMKVQDNIRFMLFSLCSRTVDSLSLPNYYCYM